jgi:hypothetical protein
MINKSYLYLHFQTNIQSFIITTLLHMKKSLPLSIFSFLMLPILSAQKQSDEQLIKETIMRLFDAMRTSDSLKAQSAFHPKATMKTVISTTNGASQIHYTDVKQFVTQIAKPRKEVYDERILSYDIRIDGNLATAWCDYAFYIGDRFSHSGVDAFQLVKAPKSWQILDIADTRQDKMRTVQNTNEIDTVMNRWHRAAAIADEDTFFGLMTENADYIGTDPSEHWKRDELRKWSEKYFARSSAWDFKPQKRSIYFTPNGQYAWFDELLTTWMGDCRGSGVLVKTNEGWRIEQYVLSMAVLNDLTKDYIKSLNKYTKKKQKK